MTTIDYAAVSRYWGLRLGYPWIALAPTTLGLTYPELTNHFFVLRPDFQPTATSTTRDSTAKKSAAKKSTVGTHL